MTKKKKPAPETEIPMVDIGPIAADELVVLLNLANTTAITMLGGPEMTAIHMAAHASHALEKLGPERWNALMVRLMGIVAPVLEMTELRVTPRLSMHRATRQPTDFLRPPPDDKNVQ